jgi:spermidine synthase
LSAPVHPRPYVRDELDARTLHFGVTEIQSRMRLGAPDALTLEYTRTMMGALLFMPAPEHIAMIGLGGGSLAKFCHRHLPRAALTVIEINPQVIALRERFEVPRDDARLEVIEADGAAYIAATERRFDWLLVDAFDAQGMPAALGAQRFYDDALDVLRPGGVFVANLHAGDPHCALHVDRLRRSFDERVLQVADRDGTNCVVFARKGAPLLDVPRRELKLAAEGALQLRGAFDRVAGALGRQRADSSEARGGDPRAPSPARGRGPG